MPRHSTQSPVFSIGALFWLTVVAACYFVLGTRIGFILPTLLLALPIPAILYISLVRKCMGLLDRDRPGRFTTANMALNLGLLAVVVFTCLIGLGAVFSLQVSMGAWF